MSDYNENNQGGYDPQSSSQSFGQGTGGAPIPPNSYYHYQGAGPGGVAGTNATAPVNPASPYAQSAGAHNAQALRSRTQSLRRTIRVRRRSGLRLRARRLHACSCSAAPASSTR